MIEDHLAKAREQRRLNEELQRQEEVRQQQEAELQRQELLRRQEEEVLARERRQQESALALERAQAQTAHHAQVWQTPRRILEELRRTYQHAGEEMASLPGLPTLHVSALTEPTQVLTNLAENLQPRTTGGFEVAIQRVIEKSSTAIERAYKNKIVREADEESDSDHTPHYTSEDVDMGDIQISKSDTHSDSYTYQHLFDVKRPAQITIKVIYRRETDRKRDVVFPHNYDLDDHLSHRRLPYVESSWIKLAQSHGKSGRFQLTYQETYTLPLDHMPLSQESVEELVNVLIEDAKHSVVHVPIPMASKKIDGTYVPPAFPGIEVREKLFGTPEIEDQRQCLFPLAMPPSKDPLKTVLMDGLRKLPDSVMKLPHHLYEFHDNLLHGGSDTRWAILSGMEVLLLAGLTIAGCGYFLYHACNDLILR